MRNEDVGFAARRRIFDTIGFTFINRLLVTGDYILDHLCDTGTYLSLYRGAR